MALSCAQFARRAIAGPLNSAFCALHTTTSRAKQKKIFYNKYIKQYKNQYQIYTGYADEIMQKQTQRFESPQLEDYDTEDFDCAEELLSEGRRRRNAYRHSKLIQEAEKGPGVRLLTWDQMEHVRFLHQVYPEEWTPQILAHSFQVPISIIYKVLRSKRVPSPAERSKLDAKARENQGRGKMLPTTLKQEPPRLNSGSALVTVDKAPEQSVSGTWGLPDWKNAGWFSELVHDEGSKRLERGPNTVSKAEDGITWLDDEENEFYSHVYDAKIYEEDDTLEGSEDDDSDQQDDELKTRSPDGQTFYIGEDEFLYKI